MKYINSKKLDRIKLTKENFYILIDFDRTLTKGNSISGWRVLYYSGLLGDDYIKDLKDINIIILSETRNKQNEFPNVTYCNSIEDCLKVCENLKYEKLFISGGATINNAFMEKGIVDNIILNYNPFVLNKGIPLFKGKYFENKLKLEKVVKEKEDIVQVHYSIIKE